MAQVWGNNAISTLSAGLGSSDTTLFIQPSHGTRFPVVASPHFCFCTLEDASGNIEIVKVTAHTSGANSFTIVRAQQGTTARSYIIGDLVELRLTALELTAFEADIDDLYATKGDIAGEVWSGVHDFTGASAVGLPANTSIGSVSATEISYLDGVTSGIQAQLNLKGNIAGQVWGAGAHDFSASSTVTLPAASSIGPVSAIEIGYLDGVTSSIQGQINVLTATKGAIAGQAWTGTHDFTAGIVLVETQPVGTNNSTAASMAALQQAVFASFANLPADPGDDIERVLTTQSGFKQWLPAPASHVANYLAGMT